MFLSVLFFNKYTLKYVHRVLKARMLKWFVIPFSSGPCFVRTLHHDPPSWVMSELVRSWVCQNRTWNN